MPWPPQGEDETGGESETSFFSSKILSRFELLQLPLYASDFLYFLSTAMKITIFSCQAEVNKQSDIHSLTSENLRLNNEGGEGGTT